MASVALHVWSKHSCIVHHDNLQPSGIGSGLTVTLNWISGIKWMYTETKALYAEQKPICFICKWTFFPLFLDHHICRDQPQYFNESSCDWKHTLLSALFFYHRSTQLSFNRRKKGRVGCQPAFITCCCEHNLVLAFAWTRIFYLNLKAFTDLKKRLLVHKCLQCIVVIHLFPCKYPFSMCIF